MFLIAPLHCFYRLLFGFCWAPILFLLLPRHSPVPTLRCDIARSSSWHLYWTKTQSFLALSKSRMVLPVFFLCWLTHVFLEKWLLAGTAGCLSLLSLFVDWVYRELLWQVPVSVDFQGMSIGSATADHRARVTGDNPFPQESVMYFQAIHHVRLSNLALDFYVLCCNIFQFVDACLFLLHWILFLQCYAMWLAGMNISLKWPTFVWSSTLNLNSVIAPCRLRGSK